MATRAELQLVGVVVAALMVQVAEIAQQAVEAVDRPPSVLLAAALRRAAWKGCAGATIEARRAAPAGW